MTTEAQRKVRVCFRDVSQKSMLAPVEDDYQIEFSADGQWLVLPAARVRADDILTVQIVNETRELKAA